MVQKTILVTGATDGIGLETAKTLAGQGHQVLVHGRNADKLASTEQVLQDIAGGVHIETYRADLSRLQEVLDLAQAVLQNHSRLDALINNAGVFKTSDPITADGLDARFVVNTVAPYLLMQKLLPLMNNTSRVINVSSAAQASVDINAMMGQGKLADMEAYAQSKLAITMWSRALSTSPGIPVIVSVNPGSLLGTKMVKEGFGVAGGDIQIGAGILCRAALDDEFTAASGQYFDNDSGDFADPHSDALDSQKSAKVVAAIEDIIAQYT